MLPPVAPTVAILVICAVGLSIDRGIIHFDGLLVTLLGAVAVAVTVAAMLFLAPLFARSEEEFVRSANHLVRVTRIVGTTLSLMVGGLKLSKVDRLGDWSGPGLHVNRAGSNDRIGDSSGCRSEALDPKNVDTEARKPLTATDYRNAFRLVWAQSLRREREPQLSIAQINQFLARRIRDTCPDPWDSDCARQENGGHPSGKHQE
ncbi:hypothetical protein [Microbispora sp. CA-102843]|uniref:hypothetical protein n=1 Tax=Microbispora sp. CA-102843 TaxID=3239952 RepID=UPI003D8BB294